MPTRSSSLKPLSVQDMEGLQFGAVVGEQQQSAIGQRAVDIEVRPGVLCSSRERRICVCQVLADSMEVVCSSSHDASAQQIVNVQCTNDAPLIIDDHQCIDLVGFHQARRLNRELVGADGLWDVRFIDLGDRCGPQIARAVVQARAADRRR
jgi:hypothetical protein